MKNIFLILFVLGTVFVMPATAQENNCVEMDIEIESTKNLEWSTCYLEEYASLSIKTSSEESTDNKIILQKDVFWNYDSDCSPARFFTLINGEEIYQQEEYFDDYKILHVPLEKGENEVEIIIATIPGLTANEYCLSEPVEPIPDLSEGIVDCIAGLDFNGTACVPLCGEGTTYANGVCKVITIEQSSSSHYVNTSPFYQALLMFSFFLWPYFISGTAIFIVLAKTPRYKKSTRIAVTLFGSAVIVWFLTMMFVGIWPQVGD